DQKNDGITLPIGFGKHQVQILEVQDDQDEQKSGGDQEGQRGSFVQIFHGGMVPRIHQFGRQGIGDLVHGPGRDNDDRGDINGHAVIGNVLDADEPVEHYLVDFQEDQGRGPPQNDQ